MTEAGSYTLSEIGNWSLTQIDCWAGSRAAVDDALARACGIAMPYLVGQTARLDGLLAIRISPTRIWLLEDENSESPRVQGMTGAAIASLTHGRRRFAIWGASARAILARCIGLELDAPNLSPGRAANTMLHRIPVTLMRNAPDSFELLVPRSFAQTAREQIEDAGRYIR